MANEEAKSTTVTLPLTAKALRERILASKPTFRQRSLRVMFDGVELDVVAREPTEQQQQAIFKAGGMKEIATAKGEGAGEVKVEFSNSAALMVWATIHCARDTDGALIFQPSDAEALLARPSSDTFCKVVGSAVMEMIQEGSKAGKT